MIDTVPMRQGSNPIGYRTSPAEVPEAQQPVVLANCATPGYLKVMGIPLRRGRFLTDQDHAHSIPVVVIDDVMAREAFPGVDPVGKSLWIGRDSRPSIVVGVVGHVRQWGLAADDQSDMRAQLYYAFAQVPDSLVRRWSELMSIAVRTTGDPRSMLQPLRAEIRGALQDQVLYEVNTLEELGAASLARQRFLTFLFGTFAILALSLAAVGTYGVLAYLTRERIPEIGVRMALGASRQEVVWMVLRGSFTMVLSGVVLGSVAALAAARLLSRIVEGVPGADLRTFALMILVLIATAMVASLVPARHASRVDPMKALRQE